MTIRTGKVWLTEEVPGVEEYRWFASCVELKRDDPRRVHWNGKPTIQFPSFEAGKKWLSVRGLVPYSVERFGLD